MGKDGSSPAYFKGITAYFSEDTYTYDEAYIAGVRFICSRSVWIHICVASSSLCVVGGWVRVYACVAWCAVV